ncbi:hypothetical protein lerEdw1_019894 [Lerista edwardsae]|nr:hypothetical protein lerEdw1_019894 [Lerista edwardsae]
MQSSQLRKMPAWEQAGPGGGETRRSSRAEGEGEQQAQVGKESRSAQQEAGARLLAKEAQRTGQGRGAQAQGAASHGERCLGPPERNGMPPNGEARPAGKPVRYLEVRLRIRDYRHTCKKQLYHLISCFFRLISGNLSSEGGSQACRGAQVPSQAKLGKPTAQTKLGIFGTLSRGPSWTPRCRERVGRGKSPKLSRTFRGNRSKLQAYAA